MRIPTLRAPRTRALDGTTTLAPRRASPLSSPVLFSFVSSCVPPTCSLTRAHTFTQPAPMHPCAALPALKHFHYHETPHARFAHTTLRVSSLLAYAPGPRPSPGPAHIRPRHTRFRRTHSPVPRFLPHFAHSPAILPLPFHTHTSRDPFHMQPNTSDLTLKPHTRPSCQ